MFDPLFNGLAWLIAFFYDLCDDLVGTNAYALSIVLLTLVIMIAFTPLTIKGTRSMMQMSHLQPEIKRLQAMHRGDRQTLNTEMMKLYQTHGVSPLGGCLPTLVQIPVFFVLYRVISGLTEMSDDGSNFAPKYLSTDSQLYQDLLADNGVMRSFGMDLARSAQNVLQESFVDALPYMGLVLVTFGLAWFQQRQMKSRRSGTAAPNRQMEVMMKVLPFMLPVFSFIVQAALAIYFVASSLYRIAQQAYIHRTMAAKEAEAGTLLLGGEEVDAGGSGAGGSGDASLRSNGKPRGITSGRRAGQRALPPAPPGRAADVSEPPLTPSEPPSVGNQRSKKALNAEQQRLQARAARSAQRKAEGSDGGVGEARVPKQRPQQRHQTKVQSEEKPKAQPNPGQAQRKQSPADGVTGDGVASGEGSNAQASGGDSNAQASGTPAAGVPTKKGLRGMFSRGDDKGATGNGTRYRSKGPKGAKGSKGAKNDQAKSPKPIQSRRTAGDGRRRKRR